jgi:hypothetical protein
MYDPPQLISLLQASGFGSVSEKSFLESRINEIADVESETRIGRNKGFVVEGVRPEKNVA